MFDIFNLRKIKELEERIEILEGKVDITVYTHSMNNNPKIPVSDVIIKIMSFIGMKLEYHQPRGEFIELVEKETPVKKK